MDIICANGFNSWKQASERALRTCHLLLSLTTLEQEWIIGGYKGSQMWNESWQQLGRDLEAEEALQRLEAME